MNKKTAIGITGNKRENTEQRSLRKSVVEELSNHITVNFGNMRDFPLKTSGG
jgi:hypothetical protein